MDERWILDNRPHTRTKLQIFKQYYDVWLTIWNKQEWVNQDWYYVDLFAGRGSYLYEKKKVWGSPLIFLDNIRRKLELPSFHLRSDIKIHVFLVERDEENFSHLQIETENFLEAHREVRPITEINLLKGDCNDAIDDILARIRNSKKNPLLAIIDPFGIKIKSITLEKIISLQNPIEVFFNYILEGVRRVGGVVKKSEWKDQPTKKELSTKQSFEEFIGHDQSILNMDDIEIMESFIQNFSRRKLRVVAFDMKYPDRNDIIYYLLFASKKDRITQIIKKIFARQKELSLGPSLFGRSFYEQSLLSFEEENNHDNRKDL